jgi:predicted HAD superfamily phosphohydrolase
MSSTEVSYTQIINKYKMFTATAVLGTVAVGFLGHAMLKWKRGSDEEVNELLGGTIYAFEGEECILKCADIAILSATYKNRDVTKIIQEGIDGFDEWKFVVSDSVFGLAEKTEENEENSNEPDLVITWQEYQ